MAKTRRQYSGGAVATTITAALASTGETSISIASATGWPSSAGVPFYVVVSPQTAAEEKFLVTRSSTTLTIVSRGVDGTSAGSHSSGATIYPVFTAVDADEANELTSKFATQGSIVYQGASTFTELGIGTAGQVLKVNSGATAPEWGQVPTSGIADDAVTAAKIAADAIGSSEIASGAVGTSELADASVTAAKIATAVAGDGLTGGAGTALSVSVDNSTVEISSDSLRIKDSGVTAAKIANGAVESSKIAADAVTSAKIADNAVGTSELASGAVTTAKIADANVTFDKMVAAAPRGVVARATNVTSNSASATTSQVSVFSTLTFTPVAGRLYMVCASAYVSMTDASVDSTFFVNLVMDSSSAQNLGFWYPAYGGNPITRVKSNYLWAPSSATSTTFNVNIGRFSGSGSIQNLAAADNPSQLYIVDVGAA